MKIRAEIDKIEKKKIIEKINETKDWFFEKNQHLVRLTKSEDSGY